MFILKQKVAKSNSYFISSNSCVSSFTEGLIVKDKAAFLIYLPLAAAGLCLLIAFTKVLTLSHNCSLEKLTLPRPAWIFPCLSTRKLPDHFLHY